MNLNHIHLHVASAKTAAAFYTRHFGMRELVWHGDMVFMRDDAGMDLALAEDDARQPLPAWFHIGFRLADADAVAAMHARMRDEGVPIIDALRREGDLTYFRCQDPDAHTLEIYFEPDPP